MNLRTRIWRWRRDATWRRAEREQAAQDRTRHRRLIGDLMRDTLLAPMPGDPRGQLLAAQWAIGRFVERSAAAKTTATTREAR